MENETHASILFVGNDINSDNIAIAQLENCGFFVDYVSSEQELIKRIIIKDNKQNLIIISDLCDKDKKIISETIIPNINVPLIIFNNKTDKNNFLSDVTGNIENIIKLSKQKQEAIGNNSTQGPDELLEAFALHEIICDSNGNVIDYKFLDADKKFLKRLNKTRDELIGKTALELYPNTEKIWIETFGRVALTGIPEVIFHYSVEFDNYYEARVYSPEKGKFLAVFIDIDKAKGKYVCK